MTNRIVIPRAARSAAYRYHPGHIAGDANANERGELPDHRAHHHTENGGRA
jgi:hypothetical protein